jgi:hypothetical protein
MLEKSDEFQNHLEFVGLTQGKHLIRNNSAMLISELCGGDTVFIFKGFIK